LTKLKTLISLQQEISQCTLCQSQLPFPPKPLYSLSTSSKILIIGQAPSLKVHQTGVLWNDASGKRLTDWLGITMEMLHDKNIISILPMGFCYPGKNKTGDLPPRKECARTWHSRIMACLNMPLILLVGSYAQNFYSPENNRTSLTETVRAWKFNQNVIPLPHPSPLNNRWLKRNPWFEENNLPEIRRIISSLLHTEK